MKIENTILNRIRAVQHAKDTIKEYASKNGFHFLEDEHDGTCYAVISDEGYFYAMQEDIDGIRSVSINEYEVPGFLVFELEYKV